MEEYQKKFLHTLMRPSDENELIVDINPYSKQLFHDTFLLASRQYFDFDWFTASIQYTKQLQYYDKYTLRSYTSNGDLLINTYLRNNEIINTDYVVYAVQIFKLYDNLSESYFTDTNELSDVGKNKVSELILNYKLNILNPDVNLNRLRSVIDTYISDLRNIILNAPLSSKDLLVFRGVKDDFLHENQNFVKLKGFQSTTYSIDSAITFRKEAIYEIIIQKHTPCIAMEYISRHSKEKEILICDTVFFKSDKASNKYILDSSQLYSEGGEYTEWRYILDKLLDPSSDVTNTSNDINNTNNTNNINYYNMININNVNNTNPLLIPKQIETSRRLYCKVISGLTGGRKNNTLRVKNKNKYNQTFKKQNIIKNITSIGNDDMKSRFIDPMIIDKTFKHLSPKDEEDFIKFILENGGKV